MAQNEIEGLDGVVEKFRAIGNQRKRKNATTRAARKAMAIVRKQAVANAKAIDDPETAERIWKNIATRAGKTGKEMVLMRVGVRGGAQQYAATRANVRAGRAGRTYNTGGDKKNPGGDTWYWRFTEVGRSGQPARPFLRPALWNNKDAIQTAFVEDFKEQLDKEIAKQSGQS